MNSAVPPPLPAATMALLGDLKAALAHQNRAATNRAVAGLLDTRAPLGPQWQRLSQLMQVSGELTLAHRAIDAFVAASGGHPRAVCSKVVLLEESGRRREADALMKSLPADVPDRGGHALMLGNAAMVQGDVETGLRQLERDHPADAARGPRHQRHGARGGRLFGVKVVGVGHDPYNLIRCSAIQRPT